MTPQCLAIVGGHRCVEINPPLYGLCERHYRLQKACLARNQTLLMAEGRTRLPSRTHARGGPMGTVSPLSYPGLHLAPKRPADGRRRRERRTWGPA